MSPMCILSIVSRKRGYSEARRVPGPDLMPAILELSQEKGYTHYFYGSTDKTLTQLKKVLLERFPKLQIAGMYSPPFRPLTQEEDQEIIDRINASGADFIWVALGAPKQEKWMYEHQHKVNGLMLGVGAAFDFIAGTTKRAPMWMQKLCLEWVYRITQDPGRMFPRYVNTNFAFLYHVHKESREIRKARGKGMHIAMIGHKRIPSREGGVEIVVEELAEKIFEEEPELRVAFQDKMEKYDMVKEEIQPKSENTVRKYQSQHLYTDTGIEIKIPMEQYKNPRSVEFITNPDGTVSVLIKNIEHLEAKM